MSLRDAVRKLDGLITDLSSLHVQTYTGNVEVDLDSLPDGVHGMDRVRDAVKQARADGRVTLVAESYFRFDGDSYNFVAGPGAEVPPGALAAHEAAVASGIKTRQALVELVKDVFG